jgi:uroporphyrinogen decarboxylase
MVPQAAWLSIKDIDKIKLPDPKEDGLGPKVLSEYRFFWENLNKIYIEKYGFLDGVHFTLGPCETAASILGYSSFLYGLYDDPSAIHRLLEMVTETLIRLARAVQFVNGPLKMIYMVEHMPAQVSRSCCLEFIVPYVKQFFDEFAYAPIKIYHNEGNTEHTLDLIPEFGANIYHFGIDAKTCKDAIGEKICLMGNIHPLDVLLTGDVEKVKQETKEVLDICKPGGGFILNSGGGLAPGTSRANLQVMIDSAKNRT